MTIVKITAAHFLTSFLFNVLVNIFSMPDALAVHIIQTIWKIFLYPLNMVENVYSYGLLEPSGGVLFFLMICNSLLWGVAITGLIRVIQYSKSKM